MIDRAQIREDLRNWIVDNVSADITEVIYANQDAPRPERPFITLLVTSAVGTENPYYDDVDDDGDRECVDDVTVNVSIQCYGADTAEAQQYLEDLNGSLRKISVLDALRNDGLAYVRTIGGVRDLSVVIGTTWETRAILEVEFRTTGKTTDNVGIIETLVAEGDIDGVEFELDINP